jgi:hypothetical protein
VREVADALMAAAQRACDVSVVLESEAESGGEVTLESALSLYASRSRPEYSGIEGSRDALNPSTRGRSLTGVAGVHLPTFLAQTMLEPAIRLRRHADARQRIAEVLPFLLDLLLRTSGAFSKTRHDPGTPRTPVVTA